MIISSTERKWTVAVALAMLLAAVSYLAVIHLQVLPDSGYTWHQLSVGDLILILLPSVALVMYSLALLMFYRKRGIHVLIPREHGESLYTGSKFPDWL